LKLSKGWIMREGAPTDTFFSNTWREHQGRQEGERDQSRGGKYLREANGDEKKVNNRSKELGKEKKKRCKKGKKSRFCFRGGQNLNADTKKTSRRVVRAGGLKRRAGDR